MAALLRHGANGEDDDGGGAEGESIVGAGLRTEGNSGGAGDERRCGAVRRAIDFVQHLAWH